MARKSPRKPDRRRTKVTKRQLKVIEARAQGKTLKESGEAAGYSPKNAAQSAYQALAGLRGRMAALLDEAALGKKVGIENYLKPALDAQQTIYAQKDGKFKDKRTLVAWSPRLTALRMLFDLHGSFPPRDPKEAAQYGVRVIRVDIPRPLNEYNQFIDTIPESALNRHGLTNGTNPAVPGNGKPPTDKNGHD
jgi:hypothetical protein